MAYLYMDPEHRYVQKDGSLVIPWNPGPDEPLDIDCEAGRNWRADGSPQPVDPDVTEAQVIQESQRRTALLFPPDKRRDEERVVFQALAMIQTDGGSLNAPQQTEWDTQKSRMFAIQDVQNSEQVLINTGPPIPADYADDSHWPPTP